MDIDPLDERNVKKGARLGIHTIAMLEQHGVELRVIGQVTQEFSSHVLWLFGSRARRSNRSPCLGLAAES